MKVTILLPVYNSEKYIKECLDSIMQQTFSDFEILIINDGSTDRTPQIIDSIKDNRIRVIHRPHGFIESLNFGLAVSKGEYIARMDADDIMMPNRIESQVRLLDEKPEIAVCSSWVQLYGDDYEGKVIRKGHGRLFAPYLSLLEGNFICHPATMIRKNFLIDHHIKYKDYIHAEDYKFWCDIALAGGQFWIITEELLKYRISADQISSKYNKEQSKTALSIKEEILLNLLNNENFPCQKEIQLIYNELEKINKKKLVSETTIINLFSILFREINALHKL